jgi:hypothetical protein
VRTARRALVRLARLDVLHRLPQRIGGSGGGSAASVYRLGLAGQRLAALHGLLPEVQRRRPEIPGTAFVRHTLAVSELHTQLIEADCAGHVELLARETEPACWRRYRRHSVQQAVLKPDSFLRLGIGDYEDSYFIEMDMGTEGSRAIESKLGEYLAYAASGAEQAAAGVFPKVLWAVPDEARANAIQASIKRLRPSERELFAVARQADAFSVVTDTSEQHTPNVAHGRAE